MQRERERERERGDRCKLGAICKEHWPGSQEIQGSSWELKVMSSVALGAPDPISSVLNEGLGGMIFQGSFQTNILPVLSLTVDELCEWLY